MQQVNLTLPDVLYQKLLESARTETSNLMSMKKKVVKKAESALAGVQYTFRAE